MSLSSSDSAFVDSMAAYGRMRAAISLGVSVIFGIIIIVIAIIIIITNKNATIKATVITLNNCTNTICNVTVQYTQNNKTITKNVNTNVDIHVGDKITINDSTNKKLYTGITLIVFGVILMSCGSLMYKLISSNKYIAAESGMMQPISQMY
jgi:hypothetical protein